MTVGCFSVLTATGGPFITLPLLHTFSPSTPPLEAVAIGMASMVPISLGTTLVAALDTHATLDAGLAATIALAVSVAVPIGTHLAQRASPASLKWTIAVLL